MEAVNEHGQSVGKARVPVGLRGFKILFCFDWIGISIAYLIRCGGFGSTQAKSQQPYSFRTGFQKKVNSTPAQLSLSLRILR